MLSRLMLGGSRPDFRLSLSGKLMTGSARIGTFLKRSTAPVATPTSDSRSNLKLVPLSTQAGSQLVSSSRSQVVKVALRAMKRLSSMKSMRVAWPLPPLARNR